MNSKPNDSSKYQTKTQKLKKTYVDKIVLFLSKKYSGFFKDKNYTQNQLVSDISKALPEKDVKNFNLGTGLSKFEKLILEKISKLESKKSCVLEMDHINQLLPKQKNEKKEIKSEKKTEKNEKEVIENKPEIQEQIQKEKIFSELRENKPNPKYEKEACIPYSTEKVEKLKQKQNDKWAILANQDHERYLQEEKEKKKILDDQRRQQKLYLEQQIKEKEIQKQKLKQDEQNFYLQNNNINPFVNTKAEGIKKPSIQQEVKPAIKEVLPEHKSLRLESELEKQKYNKEIQEEMKKFEDNEKQKKKELRERYKQIQKENEESAKLKQMNRQKKEEENINSNFFFGGESNDSKPKANIKADYNSENYLKKEKIVKEYEAKKLQREMEEKIKKEKDEEENKKKKKQKMMEEFRMGLDNQIAAKKDIHRQKTEIIKNDKMQIEKINQEIKAEKLKSENQKKDKISQYKKSLDDQIKKKKIE